MSCKIEQLAGEEGMIVFRVSGHVQSEHVSAIEELIAREGGQMAIDLSELTLVDRDAVRYLAVCEMRGIELRNCPPFLREWLIREQSR
jgi:anti-anti-sigma regulatory factor